MSRDLWVESTRWLSHLLTLSLGLILALMLMLWPETAVRRAATTMVAGFFFVMLRQTMIFLGLIAPGQTAVGVAVFAMATLAALYFALVSWRHWMSAALGEWRERGSRTRTVAALAALLILVVLTVLLIAATRRHGN